MKKYLKLILTALLSVLFFITLISCGDDKVKLPETSYEKVVFAFDGVEDSLNKKSSKSNKAMSNTLSTPYAGITDVSDTALALIYSSMQVEEENTTADVDYNETPFLQFSALKQIVEAVGDDFLFDTKYYYTFTGSIYYDFTSREATESSEYLNSYTMIFSISVSISSDDLIEAFVGMDITYTNDSSTHHQYRYSNLILDYEMDETTPTYEFLMYDLDDMLSYEDDNEKLITAEYVYLDVDDNNIEEVRKFGIGSNETLLNYSNDDFTYIFTTLRGFKNSTKYHLENDYYKNDELKSAVVVDLGILNVFNDYKSYYDVVGVESSKIYDIISSINTSIGEDLVNMLVYTGATEEYEGSSNASKLTFKSNSLDGFFENTYIENDMTLEEFLFTEGEAYPKLCIEDDYGNIIETITSGDNLTVMFGYYNEYDSSIIDTFTVNITEKFSEALYRINPSDPNNLILVLRDNNYNVQGSTSLYLSGGVIEAYNTLVNQAFPAELLEYSIPIYKGSVTTYNLYTRDDGYELQIRDSEALDIDSYRNALVGSGYLLQESNYVLITSTFKSTVTLTDEGEYLLVMIVIENIDSSTTYEWPEEKISEWLNNMITINAPTASGTILCTVDDNTKSVTLEGFSEAEINTYVAYLNTIGYVIYEDSSTINGFRFEYDSKIYTIGFGISNNTTMVFTFDLSWRDPIDVHLINFVIDGVLYAFELNNYKTYTLTVTLNAGEKIVTYLDKEEASLTILSNGIDVDTDSKSGYVVTTSGTYTFTASIDNYQTIYDSNYLK